jgi:branched-chain amino acid transport system substrate-binding protein
MRAELRVIILAASAALVAAGCGGRTTPIRIGVLSDCAGNFGAYNETVLAATELPLLERGARLTGPNPSDGVERARVAGRRVELLTGCTEGNFYSTLIAEVRRLVEKEHANVIIGPIGVSDGLVLRTYARRHPGVSFLLAFTSAQETTLHNPAANVFRFEPDGAQWVAGLGAYAYRTLRWRTAVTVAENSSFAWPEVAGFVAEFCALGGRVVDRLWTPPYVPSGFGPQLPDYAARVPAAVDGVALFPDYYQDTVGFARHYARRRADLAAHLIIGPLGFANFAAIRSSGRLLAGVVTGLNQPFASKSAAFLEYQHGFRTFFPSLRPQPSAPADHPVAIPYRDSMEAVLGALERSGGDLSHGERAFKAALARTVVDSPDGRIRLDGDRQAVAPAYLSRVVLGPRRTPVLRTLRVVPEVEQTFGGYFNHSTPPPSAVAPVCRRTTPPRWAVTPAAATR